MLDSRVIGSYISKLRKEADLTQVELADRLNVSHQAVSKWERGESLPDIGTLMELAKVFNTTIDHLLYGGKNRNQGKPIDPLVEKIAQMQPEDAGMLVNSGEVEINELVDVAPLLKTSILQKVTGKIDKSQFTLEHITELAPFLDEDTLDEMLANLKEIDVNWETIGSLAPFVGQHTLGSFIESSSCEKPTLKDIVDLAPFLGQYTDRFANEIVRGKASWDDVVSLAPFVKHQTLKTLIDETLDAPPKIKELIEVAPFLHEHTDALVGQAMESDEDIVWDDIESLAPFVKRETLSSLIDRLSEKPTNARQIADLAPFIESDKLSELLATIPADQIEPEVLTDLAPFMKRSRFSELMAKLLRKA